MTLVQDILCWTESAITILHHLFRAEETCLISLFPGGEVVVVVVGRYVLKISMPELHPRPTETKSQDLGFMHLQFLKMTDDECLLNIAIKIFTIIEKVT